MIEQHANKNLKDAIMVLVRTGLRSGELCSLEIGNINLKNCRINLKVRQTKAGYARVVPFDNTVKEILEKLIEKAKEENRDYLFCTRTGKEQTPNNLYNRFKNLLRKLAKENLIQDDEAIEIHTLRKTYISHKIMAGEKPVKVMEIVGHRNWSTMKLYLVLAPDYISENTPLPY